MTADSERRYSEDGVEHDSTPTPVGSPNSFIDSSSSVRPDDASDPAREEESPELLRFRADSLLDEMMLSAVDVSAADYGGPSDAGGFDAEPGPFDADESFGDAYNPASYSSTSSSYDHSDGHRSDGDYGVGPYADDDTHASHASSPNGNGAYEKDSSGATMSWLRSGNGADDKDPGDAGAAFGSVSSSSHPGTNGSHASPNGNQTPVEGANTPNSPQAAEDNSPWHNGHGEGDVSTQPNPEWRVMTGGGGESAAWNEYVSSFRSPTTSSGQIQKWQPSFPSDDSDSSEASSPSSPSSSSASAGEYSAPAGSLSQDYDSGQGTPSNWQPQSNATEYSGEYASESDAADASRSSEGSGYVSAMSVMRTGPRRSALLPRMSRFDIDALNREIAELHEEIRTLLPVGHDSAERAQHLLDKAHTIADSDPERSAEVEYYMQQVRTIVERTRDSRRWSNLYRDRLRTYLLAWSLLATMTLGALLLSQFQIEAIVSNVLGASQDAFFMRNFAGALGSIMAGAFGSAFGSLINMRRHAKSQYGFFDRKYGLRGLTLPIIGAVVGLLIYAIFAAVYHFAGINPSLSMVAMATPALLAFVFGFSQESLYGTTG